MMFFWTNNRPLVILRRQELIEAWNSVSRRSVLSLANYRNVQPCPCTTVWFVHILFRSRIGMISFLTKVNRKNEYSSWQNGSLEPCFQMIEFRYHILRHFNSNKKGLLRRQEKMEMMSQELWSRGSKTEHCHWVSILRSSSSSSHSCSPLIFNHCLSSAFKYIFFFLSSKKKLIQGNERKLWKNPFAIKKFASINIHGGCILEFTIVCLSVRISSWNGH